MKIGVIRSIIEKSNDGKNFFIIGAINSNKTNGKSDYEFEDPYKIEGVTFYRIKINADNNFQFVYSNIVSLSSSVNFSLAVSNPFTGFIKLQTTNLRNGTLETELYDAWGKLISTKNFIVNKGLNNNRIDGLQNTTAGFYFLRLKLNGRSVERKLIKTY